MVYRNPEERDLTYGGYGQGVLEPGSDMLDLPADPAELVSAESRAALDAHLEDLARQRRIAAMRMPHMAIAGWVDCE